MAGSSDAPASWIGLIAAFIISYLLGSIPFGVVLTRLAGGPDLRSIGSGNIGATNVLRTGKKGLAAATLLGDILKGTVAVLIGAEFGPPAALVAACGAFLGHLLPVWLGFKGGKGCRHLPWLPDRPVLARGARLRGGLARRGLHHAIFLPRLAPGEPRRRRGAPRLSPHPGDAGLRAPRGAFVGEACAKHQAPPRRRGKPHRVEIVSYWASAGSLRDEERLAWLRLIRSEGVGPRTFRGLIDRYGSPTAALAALPRLHREGGRTHHVCTHEEAQNELEASAKQGIVFIAVTEKAYPAALAATADAPPLIALRGDRGGSRPADDRDCRLAQRVSPRVALRGAARARAR